MTEFRLTLTKTGQKISFLDLSIGAPFYAHGRFWVRTDYDAGTELRGSDNGSPHRSCCSFLVSTYPKIACEEVETVTCTSSE